MHPRHRRFVAVAAAVLATAGSAGLVPSAHAAASGVDGPLALPADVTVTDADARAGDIAAIVRRADGSPAIVEVTAPTVAEAQRKAAAVPGAEGIAVDAPVRIAATAEPLRSDQWGHDALRADELPATDTSGLTVAVVDTGVRASHEDFAPGQVLCLPGSNFVADGAVDACTDPHGHGTHVAGIVAAAKNDKGIGGIAPGITVLPVRVLGSSGGGTAFAVAEGIVWAAQQGADVINASLAGPHSQVYDDAVAYATAQGSLVVAAAGNNRMDGNTTNWPAASPGALAVASTTESGETSEFSYTGEEVDIAAPGSQILSLGVAGDSSYVYLSGTSMASPYAAGVASLVKAANPAYTPEQLTEALVSTASDIEAEGRDDLSGAGLVNPLTLLTGAPPPERVVITAPTAPAGLEASGGDGVVVVEFAAVASTQSAPVSEYRLYRDGQLLRTVDAADGVSTYVLHDESVTNGTTYAYQVTAAGAGGESSRSTAVSATPDLELAAPAVPQGLQATAGDGTVTLSWSAVPSTRSAPVSSYGVFRDGAFVAHAGSSAFVDHHAANGRTYTYRVTAIGPGGESATSEPASARPAAPVVTQPPSGGGGGGGDAGGGGGSAPAPSPVVLPEPVVAPAPVVTPPRPVAPQPVVARPVVAPKPVLAPVSARVARGQRLAVQGRDYRPGSVLTVTQTFQVRQPVAVRQPVTKLVTRRVTVKGVTTSKKVPVVTGYRTVRVQKLVTRTVKLADLRVRADGSVAGAVPPVPGVAGGVLTVTGVDRGGKPVVVRSTVRIG